MENMNRRQAFRNATALVAGSVGTAAAVPALTFPLLAAVARYRAVDKEMSDDFDEYQWEKDKLRLERAHANLLRHPITNSREASVMAQMVLNEELFDIGDKITLRNLVDFLSTRA